MNLDIIIRNFNLHILSDIELEEPYLSLYEYLDIKLKNSTIIDVEDRNIMVFYGTSQSDIKGIVIDSCLYINREIHSELEFVFNIKYTLKEDILKWFIKYKFNIVYKRVVFSDKYMLSSTYRRFIKEGKYAD